MVKEIKDKLPEIQKLCAKYRIKKLWLFGSALDESRFRSDSDVDFLYVFDVGEKYNPNFPYSENWSAMLTELRKLLAREVQLIKYGKFKNPFFRESVEATKKLIYNKETRKALV